MPIGNALGYLRTAIFGPSNNGLNPTPPKPKAPAATHRDGDTVYDANGDTQGTWRSGQIVKPTTHQQGATVYDAGGNVQGTWQGNQVKAPAAPAGTYMWNNVQVTKDQYDNFRAGLSAQQPAPAVSYSAPAAKTVQQQGSVNYDLINKGLEKRSALLDEVTGRVRDRVNPYAPGSAAYEQLRGAARQRTVGDYSRGQAMADGQIGGLASGLRSGASDARSNDMRASLNQLDADLLSRSADWEMQRDRDLMGLANGDYSGVDSARMSLLQSAINQGNADRAFTLDQDANRRANDASDIQTQLGRIQVEYAPKMAQLGLDEAKVRQMILEGEAEVAKGEQAERIWKQKNSWWLGPLHGYVNFVSQVAGAAARRGA